MKLAYAALGRQKGAQARVRQVEGGQSRGELAVKEFGGVFSPSARMTPRWSSGATPLNIAVILPL